MTIAGKLTPVQPRYNHRIAGITNASQERRQTRSRARASNNMLRPDLPKRVKMGIEECSKSFEQELLPTKLSGIR